MQQAMQSEIDKLQEEFSRPSSRASRSAVTDDSESKNQNLADFDFAKNDDISMLTLGQSSKNPDTNVLSEPQGEKGGNYNVSNPAIRQIQDANGLVRSSSVTWGETVHHELSDYHNS